MHDIVSVRPIVGLEVHIELATRSKVFTAGPNPAARDAAADDTAPNALVDPVVLALPGALPVLNREAVEVAMRVGLALGCQIADVTRWDRKAYTYPDLPKGYQISQYELPLCFDGQVDLPALDDAGDPDWTRRGRSIGIIRAHLEEDAGKLLHEAPGGTPVPSGAGGSIVDLNRAGTPLLEIVTQPDFASADEALVFCRLLRQTCRFIGSSLGVMQQGHMRFEPNINCELRLRGGGVIRTPIVEIKNLNSFRAVHAAIACELEQQPKRWVEGGATGGPGSKTTRGWDDTRMVTTPQREKEEAQDYRYFSDPDLPPLAVDTAWCDEVAAGLPELPAARLRRYVGEDGLSASDAIVLVEERADAELFDVSVDVAIGEGLDRKRAAKEVRNVLLEHGARLANERGVSIGALGLDGAQIGAIAAMRARDDISAANAGVLLQKLTEPGYDGRDARAVAEYEGWLSIRDTALLERWCDEVIAENPGIVEQIRAGKQQAVGRLIGDVKKRSGGSADAKAVRALLLERIS